MKMWVCAIVGVLVASTAFAADDNILKNGNFNKGRMNWDLDSGMRVIDVAGAAGESNKVLDVELDKNKVRTLAAKVDIKSKTKALLIAFRVKPEPGFRSATPEVDQVTIRMARRGGSTFSGRAIKPSGEWQEIKWDYSPPENTRDFTFSIEFHPGAGTIWVDDVVIQEL
jgi:hypothetical protein